MCCHIYDWKWREASYLPHSLSWFIGGFTSKSTIFQLYNIYYTCMMVNRCAGGLKKVDRRLRSPCLTHFVGFIRLPPTTKPSPGHLGSPPITGPLYGTKSLRRKPRLTTVEPKCCANGAKTHFCLQLRRAGVYGGSIVLNPLVPREKKGGVRHLKFHHYNHDYNEKRQYQYCIFLWRRKRKLCLVVYLLLYVTVHDI